MKRLVSLGGKLYVAMTSHGEKVYVPIGKGKGKGSEDTTKKDQQNPRFVKRR